MRSKEMLRNLIIGILGGLMVTWIFQKNWEYLILIIIILLLIILLEVVD